MAKMPERAKRRRKAKAMVIAKATVMARINTTTENEETMRVKAEKAAETEMMNITENDIREKVVRENPRVESVAREIVMMGRVEPMLVKVGKKEATTNRPVLP